MAFGPGSLTPQDPLKKIRNLFKRWPAKGRCVNARRICRNKRALVPQLYRLW
jgi:hypothetical protein